MVLNRSLQRHLFFLKTLGLLILGLSITTASIPRCDFFINLFELKKSPNSGNMMTCHDSEPSVSSKSAQWSSKNFCACSLLTFIGFHIPPSIHESDWAFLIQWERLLIFIWRDSWSQFHPFIDPPYPKA